MRDKQMPLAVALMGYGGLIPFIGLALLSNAEPLHGVMYRGALLLYGAVILSFVGAVHWGVALVDPQLNGRDRSALYIWSVIPALIGWCSYIFAPIAAALMLILGFVFQYWRDLRWARMVSWPGWYLALRLRLTIVASVFLLVGVLPLVT